MAKRSPATGIRLHGKTYELNVQKNGVRHFVNLETDDFAEAVERAKAIRANPTLMAPAGLKAEIDQFIAYQLRMKIYTAHTARTKRNKLLLMAEFVPPISTAATITTKQLQAWHDSLLSTVTTSTIHGYMMTARAFFRWAKEKAKLRHTQPMDGVNLVASEGRARESFCSFELRDALIENAPNQDIKFILYCGFHAGMRLNEIIQARPFWFDLPGMRLVLRQTPTMKFKDREERTIPMTVEFRAFLKHYGLHEPFMLKPEVEQGRWLYRYDPRKAFTKYTSTSGFCCGHFTQFTGEACCRHCRKALANLRWVTFHTMRHTFASLLVSVGESIYKVAVWMGDNVDTVQKHYGHLAPDAGGIEKAFSKRVQDSPPSLGVTALPPGNSPADNRSQA